MVPAYLLINSQKLTTFFWILGLMWYYDNWGPTAYTYLALHGTYGFVWLIKEMAFPNKNLRDSMPLPIAIVVALLLFLPGYWTIPILALSSKIEAPPALLGCALIVYILGINVMMCSDCQTYWILEHHKGRLIAEGMSRFVRHPNYTGEVMLYSAFCLLARHWAAWLILGIGYLGVLLPNNFKKEASLSRYPAWPSYKAQSGMYLPPLSALWAQPLDPKLLMAPKKEE